MSKIVWVLLIFCVVSAKATTIRELVNGPNPNSTNYDRLIEVLQALMKRIYILCRSSIMINRFNSIIDKGDHPLVKFNEDEVEDFTFQPDESKGTTIAPKAQSNSDDFGDLSPSQEAENEISDTDDDDTETKSKDQKEVNEEEEEKADEEENYEVTEAAENQEEEEENTEQEESENEEEENEEKEEKEKGSAASRLFSEED